jgi:hypothetical protein
VWNRDEGQSGDERKVKKKNGGAGDRALNSKLESRMTSLVINVVIGSFVRQTSTYLKIALPVVEKEDAREVDSGNIVVDFLPAWNSPGF